MKISDTLVVIDMQNDVCKGIYRREELISQINQRIITYRNAQKPIIFIQHNDDELIKGSDGWQLVPELMIESTDRYVGKTHANGFFQTNLQKTLYDTTRLSVNLQANPPIINDSLAKSIEFCGAQTEFCVNTTVVFAHGLGYQNFMQRGASSTFDNERLTAKEIINFYENHLWSDRFLTFVD